MDASLVSERAVSAGCRRELSVARPQVELKIDERDRVHEGNVDFDSLGDQVLNLAEHGQVVLGLDVFRVCGVEAGNKASERCDSDTFADAENG